MGGASIKKLTIKDVAASGHVAAKNITKKKVTVLSNISNSFLLISSNTLMPITNTAISATCQYQFKKSPKVLGQKVLEKLPRDIAFPFAACFTAFVAFRLFWQLHIVNFNFN